MGFILKLEPFKLFSVLYYCGFLLNLKTKMIDMGFVIFKYFEEA